MLRQRWLLACIAALMLVAACSSDDGDGDAGTTDSTEAATTDSDSSGDATGGGDASTGDELSSEMIIEAGNCGLGTAQPATGEPLRLGGAATNIPGLDFTWGPKMAQIYFDCVNANGGIYGRPIEYSYEEGAPDPAVWTSIATKLVEEDEVLAIVSTFSLIECDLNTQYYAENGYRPIVAGVAPGCFFDDTWSAVNMGPYYSMIGGAQAAVRAGATGKLVAAGPEAPGADFNASGVNDIADLNGMEFENIIEPVPIADPAALAQRLVETAGEGGGVVMTFTGPTVVPLLQAISEQGLIDEVIWASSTPPNDPSVAQALVDCCGTDWDNKLLINAEFNVLDSGLPDQELMNELHENANPDFPLSSFGQMGFLAAKFATEALLRMGEDAEYTVETVNAAIGNLRNVESDMLCKPWYFSNNLGTGNVSNNVDRTVTPQNGRMVQIEDCFEIQATDNNPLAAIRAAEG